MKTSEAIDKITPAFLAAQKAIEPAIKNKTNPHLRNRYADFSAVWAACAPTLNDNGIVVMQDVAATEAGMGVSTRLLHTSGQWFEFGPLVLPLAKPDPQGAGSAISYAKRYALAAAVGVLAEDDDDGHAASNPAKPTQAKPQQRQQPAPVANSEAQEIAARLKSYLTAGKIARPDFETVATLETVKELVASNSVAELKHVEQEVIKIIGQRQKGAA